MHNNWLCHLATMDGTKRQKGGQVTSCMNYNSCSYVYHLSEERVGLAYVHT